MSDNSSDTSKTPLVVTAADTPANAEMSTFAAPLTIENVNKIENGDNRRVTDDDAKSVAGSEKSVSSARSGIPKKSGLKPPSVSASSTHSVASSVASKIGRPCAGQHKPAVPTAPTNTLSPNSSYSSYDYMRKITDDIGRYKLTDVQETEEYEEDFFGNPMHMYPPRRNRYSSIGSTGTASSLDALWELHPRRLSEAGLSRHSDTSAILTEDTDSFIIGQRIWVGGTKSGQIAYIGDTQFAPGEWAGIVLDNPIGKNDGSVGGVRYFQCEAKRGVFSRLTRLTRYPLAHADIGAGDCYSTTPSPTNINRRSPMSPTGSTKSLLKSPSLSISNTSLASAHPIDYRVGDRVIIKSGQGSKIGTLRYLGFTSFANGEWCGVELDEPRGKNDGTVEDRRYFSCPPNYGLFAPVSKVSKSPSNRKPGSCVVHATPRRANSRESLSNMSMASSVYTSASAATAARRKPPVPRLSTTSTPVPSRTALQDLLKEKQQHIEQLLKERDLERAEITRAASQADDAEQKLAVLNTEFEQYKTDVQQKLSIFIDIETKLKLDNNDILSQLEDERRKNEDLQFKFEEAAITKGDVEVSNEANLLKIAELEAQLAHSKKLNENDDSRLKINSDELEKLKEDNEALKVKLEHATEKRTSLENEESKSIELVQSLQSQLEDSNQSSKQMQEEYQKQIETLNADLEKRASELEVTTFTHTKEIEDAKAKHSAAFALKTEAIEALTKEALEAKTQLDARTKEFETTKYDANVKLKDLDRLKMELSGRNLEAETRLEEIQSKDAIIEKLEEKMRVYASDLEHSHKKIVDLGASGKDLEGNLIKEIDELRIGLKEKDAELLGVKQKQLDLEKQIVCANEVVVKLEDKLNADGVVLGLNKLKSEEMDAKIMQLEADLADKATDYAQLLNKFDASAVKMKSDGTIIEAIGCKLSNLELELGDNQRKLQLNEDKCEDLLKQKHALEAEITNLYGSSGEDSAKFESLNAKLREKEAEFAKIKEDFVDKLQVAQHTNQELDLNLQNVLQKAAKDLHEFEEKYANLEKNNSQLQANEEQLIKSKDDLFNKLQVDEHRIEELGFKLQKAEKDLEEIEAKNANLEKANLALKHINADALAEKMQINEALNCEINQIKSDLDVMGAKFNGAVDELEKMKIVSTEEYAKLALKLQANEAILEATKVDLSAKLDVINQSNAKIEEYALKTHANEADFEATKADLSAKLNQSNAQIKELQAEVATKVALNEQLLTKLDENKSNLCIEATLLDEMKHKLIQAETQLEDNKKQLLINEAKVVEVLKQKQDLEAQIKALLETSNENCVELNTQLRANEMELIATKAEYIKAEALIEELNQKLQIAAQQTEHDSNEFRQKYANLQEVATEFKAQAERDLCEKNQLNEALTHQLNQIKNEMLELSKQTAGDLENSKKTLLDQNAFTQKIASECENKVALLNKEIDACKSNLMQATHDLENAKNGLAKQLEDAKALEIKNATQRKESDLKILNLEQQAQAANAMLNNANEKMQGQINEINTLKNALNKVDPVKAPKESKIPTLLPAQTDASIINNNMVSDNNYKQLLEEKQFAEDQVQFLNSIIVDMQKKNEEQKARIQILESGYSPADADDLKLMGLTERKIAPRSYCDICEEFDLHETEDCPTQATDDSPAAVRDSPKEIPPQRDYCEICEAFGHLTEDCQDDQTF